jgi:hypothetical protein
MNECQVLILGAGIAGSLAAIRLADAGIDVVLLDRSGEVMTGASRWNEGKIHLGYCYLGDETMDSARLMLEGAACFVDDIERLTGVRIRDHWFTRPVVYVVDPGTQFPAELLWDRSRQLADMLKDAAGARPGLQRWIGGSPVLQRLNPGVAGRITGLDQIVDAWVTTEKAVAPTPIAAAIRTAVAARDIPIVNAEVTGVTAGQSGWLVTAGATRIRSDAVINATWESRAMIDAHVTGNLDNCSIRFKYGAFGRRLRSMVNLAPSTRILGPYGDVTPYGNGEAYFSWYPAGLAALSDDGCPPEIPALDSSSTLAGMLDGLGLGREVLEEPSAEWQVHGGFVVAHGQGDIDHAGSTLHRRDRPGAVELAPGYVSVDTGKYSLGPLMAGRAAAMVHSYIQLTNRKKTA